MQIFCIQVHQELVVVVVVVVMVAAVVVVARCPQSSPICMRISELAF